MAKMTRRKKAIDPASLVLEESVLSACLDLLELRKVKAWRTNSGLAITSRGGAIRLAPAGTADIIGYYRCGVGRSRFLAVEVKRPVGGVVSREQIAFLTDVRDSGGIALVINRVDNLNAALDMLAVNPWVVFDDFWYSGRMQK